jgi:hypothetical protein
MDANRVRSRAPTTIETLSGAPWVVGLDLSLRGAAACAVPRDWDGADLRRVAQMSPVGWDLTKGASPEEKARRNRAIARAVSGIVLSLKPRVSAVYVEDYAYGGNVQTGMAIAEMTGIVKDELYVKAGLCPIPVMNTSARKTLLQKLVRSDVKAWVGLNVKRLGPIANAWTGDQIDAFVVVNHGLMLEGGTAMSFPGIG